MQRWLLKQVTVMWAGDTLVAAACPNFCLQGGVKQIPMLSMQLTCCLEGSPGMRHGVLLPGATPAKPTTSITQNFSLSVVSCPNILFY